MKTILNDQSIANLNSYVFATYNQMYPMAAVWLEIGKRISVVRDGKAEKAVRIANNEFVKVENGVIVDATGNDATHQITRIFGTCRHSANVFKIEARNLLTENLEAITLPNE